MQRGRSRTAGHIFFKPRALEIGIEIEIEIVRLSEIDVTAQKVRGLHWTAGMHDALIVFFVCQRNKMVGQARCLSHHEKSCPEFLSSYKSISITNSISMIAGPAWGVALNSLQPTTLKYSFYREQNDSALCPSTSPQGHEIEKEPPPALIGYAQCASPIILMESHVSSIFKPSAFQVHCDPSGIETES